MNKSRIELSYVIGRAVTGILMIFFVMFTPWWVYFSVLLFLIFYFAPYYEALLICLFVDSLYGETMVLDLPLFFTTLSLILLLASINLQGKVFR
ncbi:MAG: hypothetical protein ACLFNR_02715 [Candidatus Paceibacterota bacterium]